MWDIYTIFSLFFTTSFLGLVAVYGLIFSIKWLASHLAALVDFHRQKREYQDRDGKFLCPRCYCMNEDNWPVHNAAGKLLEGGCQMCWEAESSSMFWDVLAGADPMFWKPNSRYLRAGFLDLAARFKAVLKGGK